MFGHACRSLIVLSCCAFCGCGNFRYSAEAETHAAEDVNVKYKYCIAEVLHADADGGIYAVDEVELSRIRKAFREEFPSFCHEYGMQIRIKCRGIVQSDSKYKWTILVPFACSLCTLPVWIRELKTIEYEVEVCDGGQVVGRERFRLLTEKSYNRTTFSPVALFFAYEPRVESGGRYCRTGRHWLNEMNGMTLENKQMEERALAYGVAAVVKRMENAGRLEASPSVMSLDADALPL